MNGTQQLTETRCLALVDGDRVADRYQEGRKLWTAINLASRNLASQVRGRRSRKTRPAV
jgi:predicted membrane chloride channel (bestrophin family)